MNDVNTTREIYLCDMSEIKKNHHFIKWVDEWRDELIVYLDSKNEIKIFSSICPHFGGPITYDKKNNKLKCYWHNFIYSSKDGQCLNHPIKLTLRSYNFKIKSSESENNNSKIKKKIYAVLNE